MRSSGSLRWVAPIALLGLPGLSAAQQIGIAEYALPTAGGYAVGITVGPDLALWFADVWGNQVGRCTTAAAITEYPVPTADGAPVGITEGPDGALWFTEQFGNKIGRINRAGTITEFSLPVESELPQQITLGPDGALWFTAPGTTATGGGRIGRITISGAITQYLVANGNSDPQWITVGPDGALWFTDMGGDAIGRITTAGAITEYPLPNSFSGPAGITAGQDGALWFTEEFGNRIGRISTAGAITEYSLSSEAFPVGIAAGRDGSLWFNETGKLGRITTAGIISEYPTPNGDTGWNITTGPDGELWIAGGYIGEAVFVTASLSVNPASGDYRTPLTFVGSGFAPHENVRIYSRGIGSAVLASAIADLRGAITATAANPLWFFGERSFFAAGQSSGRLGSASLSVTAGLLTQPNAGLAGSHAVIDGAGFGVYEQVLLFWSNPPLGLGTVTSNDHGAFHGFNFIVPANAPAGAHVITGTGRQTHAEGYAAFTVD